MFPVSFSEIWSHYPIVECLLLLHLYWWAQFSGSHSNPKLSFQIQRSDPDALHQCYVLRAAGRGQCAVTSERSWVRGDRTHLVVFVRVELDHAAVSSLFPESSQNSLPNLPDLPLSPSGPSDPLPSRSARQVRLYRGSRAHEREGPAGRGLALALGLIRLRASPAISVDISALSTPVCRLNRQTNAVNKAKTGLFRLKRSPPLRRSVTQLVNTRAKAALPAIQKPMGNRWFKTIFIWVAGISFIFIRVACWVK